MVLLGNLIKSPRIFNQSHSGVYIILIGNVPVMYLLLVYKYDTHCIVIIYVMLIMYAFNTSGNFSQMFCNFLR